MALDSSHSAAPAAAPHAVAHADVTIRPLLTHAEFKACVELQNDVWGPDYGDCVPASLLHVVAHMGGIIAGAFAPDGELIGFVFGLTGIRNGEVVHWSHELGVRASARNAGVGQMLKLYQRTELARRGISTLYWTFDPLMAKNAHLNLNRLGARVVDYVENMYGTTTSPLHHGLATDRLVVSWSTATEPTPGDAPASLDNGATPPILTPEPRAGDATVMEADLHGARVLWIEVPSDIQRVSTAAAISAWHGSTRKHFQWALRNGFAVTRLHREPLSSRAFYVLERTPGGAT